MEACASAKLRPAHPRHSLPGRIRDRASRLLRQALLMER
jgi:putative glutamine amidotransferase